MRLESTADGVFDSRSTRRRFLEQSAGAGATLALSGLLIEAAEAAEAAQSPKYGGRLRVGFSGGGATETLDPNNTTSFIDGARSRNLFDTLTRAAPPRPGTMFSSTEFALAESMEPNQDATRWQIKLRSGVTFHNGKPLTADDVIYTWQRVADPKNALTHKVFFEPFDLARTRKVDNLTVLAVLKRPVPDFPRMQGIRGFTAIIPQGTTEFSKPVGTGPFKFASFTPGDRSLFTKNSDYWQKGRPYVDELEMISIQDATARVNALLGGQLDLAEKLSFTQGRAFRNDPRVKIVISPGGGSTVPIYMRVDRDPFKDKRVRQAFRLAIDRPQTVKAALLGFGTVGNDVFGLSQPDYNAPFPQRKYDPEQAKFLLKQAGRENVTVTLVTSDAAPGMFESALAYQQQAKRAGINIKLNKVPPGDIYNTKLYYLKVANGQTQWNSSFPDVAVQALLSGAPFNETAWRRLSWQKRFQQGQSTSDLAKRKRIFTELQRELWDEGGYIIWGFVQTLDAAAPNVGGIAPVPGVSLGAASFWKMWLA